MRTPTSALSGEVIMHAHAHRYLTLAHTATFQRALVITSQYDQSSATTARGVFWVVTTRDPAINLQKAYMYLNPPPFLFFLSQKLRLFFLRWSKSCGKINI